jgi:two-component system CheB/CheR fusion protein
VHLAAEGSEARLDVEDSGEGMTADMASRVFDWTRPLGKGAAGPQGGLGIGLALVRQLVELHGGRVEAHSDGIGKGSRFTVWLPLDEKVNQGPRGASGARAPLAGLQGLAILLVDDSRENGEALAELLELEDARVTVETSAAAAVARARAEAFDVIISDIDMPGGDGYGMLREIRTGGASARTPAIAYSGYGSPADLERSRQAGFAGHVTKPTDIENLAAEILRVARQSGKSGSEP